MAGGEDELLVLMVGDFVAVNREGVDSDRPLGLFVKPAAHRAA